MRPSAAAERQRGQLMVPQDARPRRRYILILTASCCATGQYQHSIAVSSVQWSRRMRGSGRREGGARDAPHACIARDARGRARVKG